MTNDRKLLSFDRTKWLEIADQFLLDPKTPSSALESAYIALRLSDPVIAEKLQEEAKARRIKGRYLLNKNKLS
jgi:hypothetical protein